MPFRSSHIASHRVCSSLMPTQGRSQQGLTHCLIGGCQAHPLHDQHGTFCSNVGLTLHEPCSVAPGSLTGASPSGCTHRAKRFAHSLFLVLGFTWGHFAFCWGVPGHLVLDSGLDAFSQYPSHGSFATPASRLIAETRGAA